ncbi:MAG TPA: DUF2786 domain-containing protein [Candidatus Omnitrophota bacterium]|nr:DUF2786 domain-containing protein [Candidatus Omnitrophota bacterium]
MSDLDKLRARLRALRTKTVANGCTEVEALAAAEKVAELVDRYDLSLVDLEPEASRCVQAVVEVRKKQRQAVAAVVGAIADFCDCKVWRERDAGGRVRYVFFGLPAGVEMAQAVYDMVAAALQTAWDGFAAGRSVIRYGDDEKGSFLIGMAVSIADKLAALKAERAGGGGTALVVTRQAVVEHEFAGLGLALRQSGPSGKAVAAAAFDAGLAAGAGFTLKS